MKSTWIKAASLVLGTFMFGSFASAQSITPKEFQAHLSAGAKFVLFDIRSEASFKQGALPGALNIGWNGSQLADGYTAVVPSSDYGVIVVCQNGAESAKAVLYLRAQGYTNVVYIAGGMDACSTILHIPRPFSTSTWGVIKALFGSTSYRHK